MVPSMVGIQYICMSLYLPSLQCSSNTHSYTHLLPNRFIHVQSDGTNQIQWRQQPGGEKQRSGWGVGSGRGRCDMIYNYIINLEQQRGLFDTNTVFLTECYLLHADTDPIQCWMLRKTKCRACISTLSIQLWSIQQHYVPHVYFT